MSLAVTMRGSDKLDHDRDGKDPISAQLSHPLGLVTLPVEQRLRSRIDKFLAEYGLSRMGKAVALSWIQSIGSDTTGDFGRVRGWLVDRLNAFGRAEGVSSTSARSPSSAASSCGICTSSWQKGCPEIIPGLRSKGFWSAEDFHSPWLADLEKGFLDIKKELLDLRGRGVFQPYRGPRGRSCNGKPMAEDRLGSHCHQGGDWNVFYLFLHHVDFSKNRSMCPKTVSLVEKLPRHHKHAFFSALAPGTHVVKHNGPTNKKLRVHLPLLAPGGGLSRLRVGSETREVVAGKALVFDDSFEHEAWNDDGHGTGHGSDNDNDNDNDNGNDNVDGENAVADCDVDAGSNSPADGVSGYWEDGPRLHEMSRAERDRGDCLPRAGRRRSRRRGSEPNPSSCVKSGGAPRITLIADVWHPDLSDREVRFMTFLQEAIFRVEKRLVGGDQRKSGPSRHFGGGHDPTLPDGPSDGHTHHSGQGNQRDGTTNNEDKDNNSKNKKITYKDSKSNDKNNEGNTTDQPRCNRDRGLSVVPPSKKERKQRPAAPAAHRVENSSAAATGEEQQERRQGCVKDGKRSADGGFRSGDLPRVLREDGDIAGVDHTGSGDDSELCSSSSPQRVHGDHRCRVGDGPEGSDRHDPPIADNFLTVINRTRDLRSDDANVFGTRIRESDVRPSGRSRTKCYDNTYNGWLSLL